MKPIPLPSHVHYELLLQLLERKTLAAVEQQPALKEQVQQMIISLRKAFAQQKQLEDICKQTQVSFECRWSLNSVAAPFDESPNIPSQTPSNVNHT
ncbi:hypothetical protein C7H19_07820 [Aphanothece hegewaldii CCALA 016]|uniref:DUF5340 domain-containing protein n=1 Tax=Aphanothece hegewaldii CCALA 016 TaxID=2107694 RepID=A0A2T1LZN0_9CHRO|nr:DUF5340 domain-containing protein [Aphanothece hegewaldii]PSF37879.1 hypothetical protein C7H19_07820 [Aphanothece hegewaldii CCALA 016]